MYRTADPKPVIRRMAEDLGVHPEALRNWIRQAEADAGERDDRLLREPAGAFGCVVSDHDARRPASRLQRLASLDRHQVRGGESGVQDRAHAPRRRPIRRRRERCSHPGAACWGRWLGPGSGRCCRLGNRGRGQRLVPGPAAESVPGGDSLGWGQGRASCLRHSRG
ncbi:transposase [Kitasatospora sp. NPDC101157]|uniref:transposase n=1 Tax=Kitasatospora sp. NPDC101157 TaxID=3364098 RepID=UPI003824E774